MKSRFRAAMKDKKLPWYNITTNMNNQQSGSGDEFQYELLDYLTNLVMFSIDPEGVSRILLCVMSYVLCVMSYVFCVMSDVLCVMSYVLCVMSYVLCVMSDVLCLLCHV